MILLESSNGEKVKSKAKVVLRLEHEAVRFLNDEEIEGEQQPCLPLRKMPSA